MQMPSANNLLGNAMLYNSDIMGPSMDGSSSENGSSKAPLRLETSIGSLRKTDERLIILQKDFELICGMNLIDDEEYLYSLYLKSPAFSNSIFLCNYLDNLYRMKYPDLFERYPGLTPWLIFCATMCRSHNESYVKNLCASETIRSIQSCRASTFNLVIKRKLTNPSDQASQAKRATTTIRYSHPFFQNPIYLTHRTLFAIGKLANYCVPSDFSSLFLNMTVGKVSKFTGGNNKEVIEGFRGTFSRMVVGSLQSREIPFTCYHVAHIDDLLTTVSKVTGMSVSFNQINVGIKKNMERVDLFETDAPNKLQGNVQLDVDKHYFCLINNFQGTIESKDTTAISLRTYAATRYELSNSIFTLDEETLRQFEDIIANKEEELIAKYEKYEDASNDQSDVKM